VPWDDIGLGLRLWQGTLEGAHDTWLRWCGASGELILTGEERAAALADDLHQRDERIRQMEEEIQHLKREKPTR
jgi:hypothetical protein